MKRDMDLCRKILIEVESWPTTLAPQHVVIEGYTQEQVGHHAWLLAEEGLIEGEDATGMGQTVDSYMPRCLTFRGHDFLEHARDDTRWTRAKDEIVKHRGAMTIQVIKMVLERLMRGDIGF